MIEKLMSDKERERFIANFERKLRRDFEKSTEQRKRSLDSVLRGELPTVNQSKAKTKTIAIAVLSGELKIPLFMHAWDVEGDFNEWEFAQSLLESWNNFFLSEQFLETQKRMYYRLREQGIKVTEIYCQIEPRYLDMDSAEKKKFRNNLSKWYGRKKAKKEGDKTDKMSPRSEP